METEGIEGKKITFLVGEEDTEFLAQIHQLIKEMWKNAEGREIDGFAIAYHCKGDENSQGVVTTSVPEGHFGMAMCLHMLVEDAMKTGSTQITKENKVLKSLLKTCLRGE